MKVVDLHNRPLQESDPVADARAHLLGIDKALCRIWDYPPDVLQCVELRDPDGGRCTFNRALALWEKHFANLRRRQAEAVSGRFDYSTQNLEEL